MSEFGTFYVVTVNPGVRPNRLKKFLLKEWIPALTTTSVCLEVELWVSHRSRGRYLVCELWESQEICLQNVALSVNQVDCRDVRLRSRQFAHKVFHR